jgi:hypothetical protein
MFKIESFDTIPDHSNKSIAVDVALVDKKRRNFQVSAVFTSGHVIIQGMSCSYVFTSEDIAQARRVVEKLLTNLYSTVFLYVD